jgi:hypothetical protein
MAPGSAVLRFKNPSSTSAVRIPVKVLYASLLNAYRTLGKNEVVDQGRSLMVLGACSTIRAPGSSFSLLDVLFGTDWKHVIAAETDVPDSLGAAFTVAFYTAISS